MDVISFPNQTATALVQLRDLDHEGVIREWGVPKDDDIPHKVLSMAEYINVDYGRQPTWATVSAGRIGTNFSLVRSSNVNFPMEVDRIEDSQVSPSGERVAMLLRRDRPRSFTRWVTDLLRITAKSGGSVYAICTCKADGSNLRELGSTSFAVDPQYSEIFGLQWLPNDTEVSFRYDNALWIAPVK